MGRRSSPTGSRKMYSGSHTLELGKTGRKTLVVVCGYLYLKRKNSSFRLFHSICTSPIRHFVWPQNFAYPLFFLFPGITLIPREIEGNIFAKFWGVNKVYYERCANGESYPREQCLRVGWKNQRFTVYLENIEGPYTGGLGGRSLQGISLV